MTKLSGRIAAKLNNLALLGESLRLRSRQVLAVCSALDEYEAEKDARIAKLEQKLGKLHIPETVELVAEFVGEPCSVRGLLPLPGDLDMVHYRGDGEP